MKKIVYSFALFLLVILPGVIWAQGKESSAVNKKEETVLFDDNDVIADMDFENVQINRQKNGDFVVEMDVVNHHSQVLANMIYAVQLLDGQNADRVVWEKIYADDPVTISPESKVHKRFSFVPPAYLGGTFLVQLTGSTQENIPIDFYKISTPVLLKRQIDKYINVRDCSLFVNDKEQFKLHDGLDVGRDEKLVLTCDLNNPTDKEIKFIADLKIYRKNVSDSNLVDSVRTNEVLEGGKTKNFTVDIPVSKLKSDYYDLVLLLTSEGKEISNIQKAHFVVQGHSGSIASVSFDKSSYGKGDKAQIKVTVAGSADSFPGSRAEKNAENTYKYVLRSKITSGGVSCAKDLVEDVKMDKTTVEVLLSQSITQNCSNPVVELSLTDDKGNVLDELSYTLKQSADDTVRKIRDIGFGDKNVIKGLKGGGNLFSGLLVLGIVIFLIGVALFFVRKKGKGGFSVLFFLFFVGGMVLGGKDVYAGTVVRCGPQGLANVGYCSYDVDVNSNCNTDRAVVTGTAKMGWFVCRNNRRNYRALWNPVRDGNYQTMFSVYEDRIDYCTGSNGYTTPEGSGRCKPGSTELTADGRRCISDSRCDKNYFTWPNSVNDEYYGPVKMAVGSNAQRIPNINGVYNAYFQFIFSNLSNGERYVTKKAKRYTINNDCGNSAVNVSLSVDNQVCLGQPVHLRGEAFPSSGVTVYEHKIVKGSNCNALPIHHAFYYSSIGAQFNWNWSNPNVIDVNDNTNFTAPGNYTVAYRAWGKTRSGATIASNCLVKNFQVRDCNLCGPANGGTFSSTDELFAAGLCKPGSEVNTFNDFSGEAFGSTAAWRWVCSQGGISENCEAQKEGVCNPNPTAAPYTELNGDGEHSACKYGHFNSVHLVGGVLKWTCGTNGYNDRHVGSFVSNDPGAGSVVPADGVQPTAGGDVDCQCRPSYEYTCETVGYSADCSQHCGEVVTQINVPKKVDKVCFPGITLTVDESEHPCPDKQITCPPCNGQNGGNGLYNEF